MRESHSNQNRIHFQSLIHLEQLFQQLHGQTRSNNELAVHFVRPLRLRFLRFSMGMTVQSMTSMSRNEAMSPRVLELRDICGVYSVIML